MKSNRTRARLRPVLGVLCWLSSVWVLGLAQAAGPALQVHSRDSNSWVRLSSLGAASQVHTIESSTSYATWTAVARVHDGPFEFSDPASGRDPRRFYRLTSRPRGANDDGKNIVRFPDEPFRSQAKTLDDIRWVKFAVLDSDTNVVWFQDSSKYLFHYDFCSKRLDPFEGMSPAQFDAATLYRSNRVAVLGAVLYPPADTAELGIQFVGLDAYEPEEVVRLFRLVESAVNRGAPATAFYMPAPEQAAIAGNNRAYFEQKGVRLSRVERWLLGDVCYAPGWALGRLVFVPASQINTAYADGRLKPDDILITDGVPAEVPYVAGLVSLVPATPNAHVAILARSYGVPFVYPLREEDRTAALGLVGREVLLRLDVTGDFCDTVLTAVDSGLDPQLRAGLLSLKAPGVLRLTPMAALGALAADTAALTPSDIQYFGGKAAHYGLLRQVIPAHCEPAMAFSFDLWNQFLDQELPDFGRTLRQEIQMRTAHYVYPPDIASVRSSLAGIRDLVRRTARFTPAQQEAVLSVVAVFDPNRKVRFRSSTNVEDSEQFTGAGLYDSYSGCPADDLDGDTVGASQCDPAEPDERGVFRALQRVYASFYNDNAWLERLRFGVDESQVGMAVLVHHSFPDPYELANGVATVQFHKSGSSASYSGQLATQLGAVSVANPAGGVLPELVDFDVYSFGGRYLTHRQYSNLVPWGDHVMAWEQDYLELAGLLVQVVDGYSRRFPTRRDFLLDLEYKKIDPGKLVVKQVREVPASSDGATIAPFLLNKPDEYCLVQGERGDVLANHRLKCRLLINTRNLRLVRSAITNSIHVNCTIEFAEGTNRVRLEGGPAGWPGYAWALQDDLGTDSWSDGHGPSARRLSLETQLTFQAPSNAPVLVPADLYRTLRVKYAQPVRTLDYEGKVILTDEESVVLAKCPAQESGSVLQHRSFTNRSGLVIETSFYWPPPPRGATAGYTAPLVQWVQTRVAGLTSHEVVLRDYYSQTYHPGHHNFSEEFLFEPGLEPGLSVEVLDELTRKNIRAVGVYYGHGTEPDFYAIGLDGAIRRLN